ncbi:MAG: type II secretion system F family protein [Granulosicoccus sp.]
MSRKSRQHNYKLRGAKGEMSLVVAFFQMSHLMSAGVGIEHCLEEVANEEASWKLRRVWRYLSRQIKDGSSLSKAMSDWPGVFSSTLVAMVQSGESSGQMASSLNECRQMLLWRAGVSTRIQTVLVYPVFAFVTVLAVVAFLLIYLVPSIAGFLDHSASVVPWHTVVLLQASRWLQHNYAIAIAVAVLIVLTAGICYRYVPMCQEYLDRKLLASPCIGRLLLGISLSRYSENCARLYERGLPLDTAMHISEGVVSNRALRGSLTDARLRVVSGSAFSSSIARIPCLPAIFVRMIKAGDTSGYLKDSLMQASVQQQQMTDTRIDRIEKMIGPLLLIVVGIVLLWVVVSLFAPIYQTAIDAVIGL